MENLITFSENSVNIFLNKYIKEFFQCIEKINNNEAKISYNNLVKILSEMKFLKSNPVKKQKKIETKEIKEKKKRKK